MRAKTVLYLDMWIGERIQEMKLAGMRRYAAARGWEVVPISERASRRRSIARLLKRFNPVGCVVECANAHEDLPPDAFGNVPVVYLDAHKGLYGDKIASISHDTKATVAAAFRELSSNKPSSYAVVECPEKRYWSILRIQAFLHETLAAGEGCAIFHSHGESRENRLKRLSRWLAALPRKCGIFAVNDMAAFDVIEAARLARRQIPSDLTLVGVDNLVDLCEKSSPRLSSIQIDFERAGYRALERLDDIVSKRKRRVSRETFSPLMTIRRESTRGFNRKEPRILLAVEYIRREACNGLTSSDVINHVGGSRRLVELRFRETLGHSILDEIQNVRFERIYLLLARKDIAIGAIAAQCGYKSEITLRKAFVARTGISMRTWRLRNG